MDDDTARVRFAELYARCWPVGGKPGGLLADEAAEFARLAHALGITITWQRFELVRTLDFVMHPTAAGEE